MPPEGSLARTPELLYRKSTLFKEFSTFYTQKVRFLRTFSPRRAVWPELQSFYKEKYTFSQFSSFLYTQNAFFGNLLPPEACSPELQGLKLQKQVQKKIKMWRIWSAMRDTGLRFSQDEAVPVRIDLDVMETHKKALKHQNL